MKNREREIGEERVQKMRKKRGKSADSRWRSLRISCRKTVEIRRKLQSARALLKSR